MVNFSLSGDGLVICNKGQLTPTSAFFLSRYSTTLPDSLGYRPYIYVVHPGLPYVWLISCSYERIMHIKTFSGIQLVDVWRFLGKMSGYLTFLWLNWKKKLGSRRVICRISTIFCWHLCQLISLLVELKLLLTVLVFKATFQSSLLIILWDNNSVILGHRCNNICVLLWWYEKASRVGYLNA